MAHNAYSWKRDYRKLQLNLPKTRLHRHHSHGGQMGPYSVCAVSRRCSSSRTILDSQGQDRVRYRVWLYGFPLHLKSTWLAAMLGRDVQQTQVVMLAFSFALLALLSPQSQVPAQPPDIPSFTISVDQPVYSGQPIWVRVVDGPRANIRYPFHAVVGDIGCNRLEVTFNGVLLKPLPIQRGLDQESARRSAFG